MRTPGLLFLLAALASVAPVVSSAADLARGRQIFETNCASCHGAAGKPDLQSPVVQALAVKPANFSDPLFNSREPASHWQIVIAHGGPALGFSELMPAFGEALGDEGVKDVLAYSRTLAGAHDYPDGGMNLFLSLRTKKAFPEDEWVWKVRHTDKDGPNQWRNTLEYEWRIGTRWQGVLEASHIIDGSRDRFDVVEPGFKYVLHHDASAGRIVTLGGNLGVPLRSDRDWEVLPYIAYGKVLNEQWTLQTSARLKMSLEDFDHSSAEFAGTLHWTHTISPRAVFPGIEVVAEAPFERGPGVSAVQVSVLPQMRIGLSKRGHVALNLGVELPVNDSYRYDWRGYAYLIWDIADGGFFEGW
ncbi:MAG: cytochrome c [Gammaproteobacteria bacterium]|nr:cytochrome c [Gammaproteobacteria bacterium]